MNKNIFYSQQGEDILIYLKYINNIVKDGIYLELGAFDGTRYSNSKFFEETLNFRGVLIEAQREQYLHLKKNRDRNRNIFVNKAITTDVDKVDFFGKGAVGGIKKYMSKKFVESWFGKSKNISSNLVETERIDNLLERCNISYIDLFILDVEGGELSVLETINFNKVEIYLFCIELDNSDPNKDNKCREILRNNNFILCDKFCINEFWINNSYSKKDRLYTNNAIKFTGIENNKKSNIGYHPYTEKHLLNTINDYLV